jgi:tetratricopeptide (TPR) repeat protein
MMRARGRSVLLLVAALLLATACRRRAAADLPPLARALLAEGQELGAGAPSNDEDAAALRAIAATARAELARTPSRAPAAALNRAIFETTAFVREVDDHDLRFVLLPSVLQAHRGSCVGLGTLYLAVAELVGVRARGIMVPGHFYVQVDDRGRWRNVELLRRGEEMPEAWYRDRYGARGSDVAGRPLSPAEVTGVVAYDVGNERRRQGRLPEARRAYERAVRDFPGLAEAHASLGATLQLLGALDQAAAAYASARRLDPQLPGLGRNVELLNAERAATRKSADVGASTRWPPVR